MSFDIRYHAVHPFRIVEAWIFTDPRTAERSGSQNPDWVAEMHRTPAAAARGQLAFYESWKPTSNTVVTGHETNWVPMVWDDLRAYQVRGWAKVARAFEMAEQLGYPHKCVEYFGKACQ